MGTRYEAMVPAFGSGVLLAVPILVEGRFWGGLATTTPPEPLSVDVEERVSEFAELAAAVANAENKAKLRASTGLTDRVDALNGTLSLASPPGRGTAVEVTLPLAGRAS